MILDQPPARRRGPGQLETAVLAALWAAEEPLTPAQVQTRLASSGRALAYTSVMTTLSRLHGKGLADRRLRGRAWAYTPTPRAADAAAGQMRSLLGEGASRAVVLSRFVAGLSPDDEALLTSLLPAVHAGAAVVGATGAGAAEPDATAGAGSAGAAEPDATTGAVSAGAAEPDATTGAVSADSDAGAGGPGAGAGATPGGRAFARPTERTEPGGAPRSVG